MGGAKACDGIYDEKRVRLLMDDLCDPANVVAHTGGAFRRLHEDGADIGSEPRGDFLERERFAVRPAQHVYVAAECLSQPCPALAEFSSGEDEDFVARRSEIRYRGFHRTGA